MRDALDLAEFDQSFRQETKRPAAPACRRTPAGQRHQVGLRLAVQHSRSARHGTADEDSFEPPSTKVWRTRGTVIGPMSSASLICRSVPEGRGLPRSAFSRMRARVNLRAAAAPLATSDSNCGRSSSDNRTTNFLFMIGLLSRGGVRTAGIGQKSEELINITLTRH